MLISITSHKGFLGGFLAFTVAIGISTFNPAIAAEDGSLDSMWMDQNGSPNTKQPAAEETAGTEPAQSAPVPQSAPVTQSAPTPAAADTTTTSLSTTSTRTALDTVAPMCSLSEFKNSALVSKGGWPGVGPFKATDAGTDFSDDNNNQVRLDVAGDKITRAELTLARKQLSGSPQKDLLDMQMNIDFLLEAVGIKPKKIQDLNSQVEKNRELLLKADQNPLNLTIGRYSVNIEKKPAASGSSVDFIITVNSLDANKKIIREHSTAVESKPPATPTADARYVFQDTSTKPDPVKPPKVVTRPPLVPVESPHKAAGAANKDQFATVIGDWQKVKRSAVKSRQTEELSSILSGKALARQMDAIKWLVTNKKFYELNPKGVVVDQFIELTPSKKYQVMAQVREAYRFIDEPSGKVLKEVDDINHVNYTIEKVAGKWLITDSALLTQPKSANGKAAATNNKTH